MADTTNVGNIEFDLTLDTKGLQQGAKKAESVMSRLDRTFQQLGNINQAGEMFFRSGKAVFQFGKQFIDAAAQIERFRVGLTSVTGSAAEADRQLKRLREVAKLPGLGFPEAVQGSTRLQAAGFSAEKAEESLRAFGNALASVGKGKAELDGVILALTQMAAKGKLSAEEINQIAERVPQIRQVMKDAFGTAIPKDIEAMGITVDDFVSGVNKSLLRIPPVAQTASNAFENFGDTLNQLKTTIGNMALSDVTRLTTDWTDKISGLNEMLMPANERLEAVGNRISAMTTSFKAQNTETEILISRYTEIKTALAEANIDTEESERLHGELLTVVESLKSQLPALIGLWGEEGGSLEAANGALARRLELQKRLVRNEFAKELKKSTRELRMQELQITRAEEKIDAYQKTVEAFKAPKRGETGVAVLAGLTFAQLEKSVDAMALFKAQMDAGQTSAQRSTLALNEMRKEAKEGNIGLTVGDYLGGLMREEQAAIQASKDSMAGLNMQLENLVRISGDADVSRFEQLISTFSELQTETQTKAWNQQLKILAKNLGLNEKVLTQFIRLSKDASQLPPPKVDPVIAKVKGQAELDKEAKALADKQKKADDAETARRQEVLDRRLKGEADLRAEQEMLRKLEVKLEREVEAGKVAEAKKTQVELDKLKAKQEQDAKEAAKAADDERKAYSKYWKDKRAAMQAEIELSNALQLARAELREEHEEATQSVIAKRDKEIDDRIAKSAEKGVQAEVQFEIDTRKKGLQAVDDLYKDADKKDEERARGKKEQLQDWADGITQVADAASGLIDTFGIDSSILEEGFQFLGNSADAISKMASGNIVGGVIQLGAALLELTPIFKKLKEEARQQPILESLHQRLEDIDKAFLDKPTRGNLERRIGHLSKKAEEEFDDAFEVLNKRLIGWEDRARTLRSQSQMVGGAVLEGLREGFSENKLAATLDSIAESLDKMLYEAVLKASLENAPMLAGAMDGLVKDMESALSVVGDEGAIITDAERAQIQTRRDAIEGAARRARANAEEALKVLDIDTEKLFPKKADAAKEDRRTPGLSVAIRNITTRQADTLTRVLRGQMSLMSQVAGNTLRSAVALEAYLPSINTNAERQAAIPAGYTTAPPASAPDRSDALSMVGMGRNVSTMDSYLQKKAADGG